MPKIFGENSFWDDNMINVMTAQDSFVLQETHKAVIKMGVKIDKAKLERWIRLCYRLEHINESDLIDIATQKKFADLETALNLAVDTLSWVFGKENVKHIFEDYLSVKKGTTANDCLCRYIKRRAKDM